MKSKQVGPRLTLPVNQEVLQPLKEIGSMEKTQFWDFEQIQEALREVNRFGIPVKSSRSERRCKLLSPGVG